MQGLLNWFQGMWGREELRERVGLLERTLKTAREMVRSVSSTSDQVIESNRQLGKRVTELEEQNRDLTATVQRYADNLRKIDPNAKCPCCGGTQGHLTHVARGSEVRCVNNCEICGFTFISGEPIAGAQLAAQLYQMTQEQLK